MTKQNHNQLPGALDLFKPSWEAFKLNWQTFVISYIAPALITIGLFFSLIGALGLTLDNISGETTSSDIAFTAYHVLLIGIVVLVFVGVAGFTNALIYWVKFQSAKGKKVDIKDAVRAARKFFWRLLGLSVLRGFIITLGLIAFIVPGLFLWRRLFLSPYYLMDKNVGVIRAMSMSEDGSKPFSYALWPMLGVYILINVVSYIPVIGWLASLAGTVTYSCAAAVRQRQAVAAK